LGIDKKFDEYAVEGNVPLNLTSLSIYFHPPNKPLSIYYIQVENNIIIITTENPKNANGIKANDNALINICNPALYLNNLNIRNTLTNLTIFKNPILVDLPLNAYYVIISIYYGNIAEISTMFIGVTKNLR